MIGDAGAASLGEAIKQHSSLQSLDVRYVWGGSERVWRGEGVGGEVEARVYVEGVMLCGECIR